MMTNKVRGQLMELQHQERLVAAQRAREQAHWKREPNIFARLIAAIRARLRKR